MNGERYLGNTKTKEVHDLDNENANCQIDEIIKAKNDSRFVFLYNAYKLGYRYCDWCLKDNNTKI